jgi:hypothetical protein
MSTKQITTEQIVIALLSSMTCGVSRMVDFIKDFGAELWDHNGEMRGYTPNRRKIIAIKHEIGNNHHVQDLTSYISKVKTCYIAYRVITKHTSEDFKKLVACCHLRNLSTFYAFCSIIASSANGRNLTAQEVETFIFDITPYIDDSAISNSEFMEIMRELIPAIGKSASPKVRKLTLNQGLTASEIYKSLSGFYPLETLASLSRVCLADMNGSENFTSLMSDMQSDRLEAEATADTIDAQTDDKEKTRAIARAEAKQAQSAK